MTDRPTPPARTRLAALLLVSSLVLVAACGDGKGGKGGSKGPPSGQVVARLDGTDITQLEVNAELAGMNVPPDVPRREAEKAALNNIITRRLMVEVARDRKLHENPQFQLMQRRMGEQLHVQALAQNIASQVQKPASDEVDRFMEEHAFQFRDRKILAVDQLQFLQPADMSKLDLPSIKTMAALEQTLRDNQIEFRRQPAQFDALQANPAFIREVLAVYQRNPQELFMFAQPVQGAPAPVMVVNQITEIRTQPFTGPKARELAERMLQNQRIQAALAAEVDKQRAAAKGRVTFQEGWEIPFDKQPDPRAVAGQARSGPMVPSAPPTSPDPTEGPGVPAGDPMAPAAGAPAVAGPAG